MKRETIIKSYFQAWLDKEVEPLKQIFSKDVVYNEYYGPEYHGIVQVLRWFSDWNKQGTVLEWKIKKFIHQDMYTVVEWSLKNNYNGEIDCFDGASIIEFDEDIKIVALREFQSKAEHNYPYE